MHPGRAGNLYLLRIHSVFLFTDVRVTPFLSQKTHPTLQDPYSGKSKEECTTLPHPEPDSSSKALASPIFYVGDIFRHTELINLPFTLPLSGLTASCPHPWAPAKSKPHNHHPPSLTFIPRVLLAHFPTLHYSTPF